MDTTTAMKTKGEVKETVGNAVRTLGDHPAVYILKLRQALEATDKESIVRLIELIGGAIGTDATVFFAGNGGSAATCSHMACDLGKTILGKKPRENPRRLRTVSLNDCIPMMTAWGNDEGYDFIFSEQLKSLGRPGDILVIITGSGNSKNIIEAVKAARDIGMRTFGLLGFGGGAVKPLLDDFVLVPSSDYGVVEDAHSIVNHLVTDWLKRGNSVEGQRQMVTNVAHGDMSGSIMD